jgi:hypothetical protein
VNVSAYITSVLRTVIPSAWGALIAWLISIGILTPELAAQAQDTAVVWVAIAIGVYYALVRFLESQAWWPGWLSAVLLGSPTVPVYRSQTAPEVTGR